MEDELINKLKNTVITYMPSFTKEWEPNFRESYRSFTDKVRTGKKLIEDGEALQVVLSMRADLPEGVDPYRFYLKLRSLNPSPYMFFLKSGPIVITGSSPEIHVLVAEGKVVLKPIAGTVPRGKTEEDNNRNKQRLLADEKERAEHLMLVDLARNDLARIARPESVKVTEFMQPEDYSHVIHLVSQVEAALEENAHAADVLRETFPAGTVSGAPKVRAMEIIDELEKDAREAYAGAVGYIGYNGYTDTCITIRTAYFTPNGNYIQAGAGIVADSDPDGEFNEICNKLRALSVSMPFARG